VRSGDGGEQDDERTERKPDDEGVREELRDRRAVMGDGDPGADDDAGW